MAAGGDLTWWCRKDRKIVQHDKVLKLRLETSFSGFFFLLFCQKTPHPPHSTKERTNRSQFQSLEKGSLSHTTYSSTFKFHLSFLSFVLPSWLSVFFCLYSYLSLWIFSVFIVVSHARTHTTPCGHLIIKFCTGSQMSEKVKEI